jgi:hypothetical protein
VSSFLSVLPGSVAPTICFEVDLDNDPTSGTTTWTDFTSRLVAYSRQPVRSNEFDQPQGAGAQVKLRNDDGALIPDNTAGAYYGKLKKLRRCRVRAQWGGVTYNRFKGYVEDWPQTWDMAGKDQTVTLQLKDGLKPLETFDLGGRDYGGALTGALVAQVLTDAGITAQNLDVGQSNPPDSGVLSSPTYALQRVHDIAATENGVAFADGGGTIQFHDRHHRIYAGTAVPSATIGDSAGEVRYTGPQPIFGDVWPIVKVTPAGATTAVVVTNDAGTASFFQQTLVFPTAGNYLVDDPAEALAAAQYLAGRYSQELTRIPSVDLIGARDPTTWPVILNLDTSDRVVFRRRWLHNGTIGGTVEIDGFIEGYGEQVTVGQDWRVNVPISPGSLDAYWILGDPVYGVLGVTTTLSY